jgi:hypothetical protein
MNKQTQTILLVGVAALAAYFIFSKPAVTQQPVAPLYNPLLHPATTGNTTASEIAAGGTAAAGILDAINNLNSDD